MGATEEEIAGSSRIFAQLNKRLVERAMDADRTEHVCRERDQEPRGAGNQRSGTTPNMSDLRAREATAACKRSRQTSATWVYG